LRDEPCTEIKEKIAKVGLLMGLLGQVSFESVLGEEESQRGKVLLIAILSFLFVQLSQFESCQGVLNRTVG